jgi:hypothetical protein
MKGFIFVCLFVILVIVPFFVPFKIIMGTYESLITFVWVFTQHYAPLAVDCILGCILVINALYVLLITFVSAIGADFISEYLKK